MPEYRAQYIDQRDASNKKTNGEMQLHVRHYTTLLGSFGNGDAQLDRQNADNQIVLKTGQCEVLLVRQ